MAIHTTVQYCSFKHLNQDDFLTDLSSAAYAAVFEVSDPTKALSTWHEAFLPVIEKTCASSEEEISTSHTSPLVISKHYYLSLIHI